jgi:hypothetical protein
MVSHSSVVFCAAAHLFDQYAAFNIMPTDPDTVRGGRVGTSLSRGCMSLPRSFAKLTTGSWLQRPVALAYENTEQSRDT